MFGTIARMKVRPDKLRDFYALGKEWDAYHRTRAVGYISSEVLWERRDDLSCCMVVHFVNEESYWKNAQSPEQHQFYLKMRECLAEDPVWIDGNFDRWDTPYARLPSKSGAEQKTG